MKMQGVNPFLPSYEYIPDGEPYVFADRLYIFGSHDKFDGKDFCLNNYVSWSAPTDNLGNWQYEGMIYDKFRDPLIKNESLYMYAPDVQKGLDGRYYLFYFFGFIGVISVAVCDKPAGDYKFYGHIKYKDGTLLGKAKNDPFMFDPAVFIDDDGRVFLYIGFSPKPITRLYLLGKGKLDGGYVIELESDLLTVKKAPKLLLPRKGKAKHTKFEHHEFFEASSMRKRNDIYYYIYSSDKNHELCYATSKNPDGQFEYGGTIISNADIGYEGRKLKEALNYYGNNHGSIVQVNGKWYIFYHRQTNRREFSRQACAEEIHFEKNGSIKQVEITSCGLNGGSLVGKGTYSSHIACNLFSKKGTGSYSPLNIFKSFKKHPYFTQTGIDRENNPDQYIANMRDGAVAGFKYFNFHKLEEIDLLVWGNANGEIQVFTDLNKEPIGRTVIKSTYEPRSYSLKTTSLNGVLPLYIKYIGKGSLNFISFTLK